jgi:hypothetical protein
METSSDPTCVYTVAYQGGLGGISWLHLHFNKIELVLLKRRSKFTEEKLLAYFLGDRQVFKLRD